MPPKTEDIVFGRHRFRIAYVSGEFQGFVVGDRANLHQATDKSTLLVKLTEQALKQDRSFFGLDGARQRFLTLFPAGFSDPDLIGDKKKGELSYKRAMREWLAEHAPFEATKAGKISGETIARAFQHTNLVDPHTKTKLSSVLRGHRSTRFVEVLVRFADGDIKWASERLAAEFSADGVATWPSLTYLAFFWKPERHAFLKPEVSQEYARRVGHRFSVDYISQPEPNTYLQYLDMLDETGRVVADLGPRDYIDLHSFIWAVSKYDLDVPFRPWDNSGDD